MRPTRWAALLMLLAYLPACTSYTMIADPAATLQPDAGKVHQVRVTLRSGEQLTLRDPEIARDTLRGTNGDGAVVSVELPEVSAVQEKGINDAQSIALGIVGLVAFVSLITLVSNDWQILD